MPHQPFLIRRATMTSLKLKTLLATLALAASGASMAQQSLLNVSYDVAREFYKDYNAAFAAHYKKTTGQDVKIDQSHAGSSAQARAVNDGLAADVVTMNTTTDVQFLADSGVVAKDWAKKFPHDASPTTSTMLFLVRNGNPKGIKDWDDLIKPGVQVIVVNPKTGGNGRYAYLAAWGAVREKGGTEAQAAEFVAKLYKNVPVLAKGGRDATATGFSATTLTDGYTESTLPTPNSRSIDTTSDSNVISTSPMLRCKKVAVASRPPLASTGTFLNTLPTNSAACASVAPFFLA